MKKLKITERGFAGHFICSSSCLFHRNTLLEYGNDRIIVSTVGNYRPKNIPAEKLKKEDQEIGINRFYETMAFEAIKKGVYWEINVQREIDFKSNWAINNLEENSDLEADLMHDKIVKEISKKMIK